MTKYWGKYNEENAPRVRFDPLQCFMYNGAPVGYRIHVVPTRGKRPRDHKIPSAEEDNQKKFDEEYIQQSVLYRISKGNELGIAIAGDDKIIGRPDDEATEQDLSQYNGIAIVNKYSPLNQNKKEAGGVSLVVFPTSYVETLINPDLNYNLLIPLRTAIRYLIEDYRGREDLQTPMIFFNIGPSSGASLKHLHAQSYVTTTSSGLITYTFNQAYNANNHCLACRMAKKQAIRDHIGQELQVGDLTIWEDSNIRLIVPHAPIRPLGLRILIKPHIAWIGEATDDVLRSLALALSYGHKVIIMGKPPSWPTKRDRTIAFRQTEKVGKDFHMFVDILPSIPLGGAEVIDSLSVTSLDPPRLAKRMRRILNEEILSKAELTKT